MVMMGYLLKEALKTLCGINQWSYAVFWKFGCQNPKLLIWEECYYEPASCYGNLRNGVSEGNKVHLLVNKMMMDNHVNVVGEGLVGRVAFSGNHQWILSENYYRETHPPEVLKDVCLQFSASMQTVAVVPILPHGVAQFGSYSTITENIGFVDGVVSLIHELGCVPGVLQSTSQETSELVPKVGFPVCPGYPTPRELPLDSCMIKTSSFFGDNLNYIGCSSQTSAFDNHIPFSLPGEVQNEMQSNLESLQVSNSSFSFPNQFMNGIAKAEVIPSNSFARMNPYSSPNFPRAIADLPFCNSSALTHASIRCTEQKILPENIGEGHFMNSGVKPNPGTVPSCNDDASKILSVPGTASEAVTSLHSTSSGLKNTNLSKMEMSFSDSVDHSGANSLLAHCKEEMKQNILTTEIPLIENQGHPGSSINDRTCFESQSGEDLFDVLGADFKDQWLNNCWRSSVSDESTKAVPNSVADDSALKNNRASSEMYHPSQGKSDNGISSFTGTNHLLDDTNTSGSSSPMGMLPYGRFGVSDNMKGDLLGMTKTTPKAGMICSPSLSAASLKEDSGIYSQGSSIYDPWIERGHNTRQSNSAPTGYSTKPHEPSKSNRKRLKPGESPRPRPKDRQMIQDRVKELRDIVPNGAKCSIDTLLERTIKHMLFLQSVAKHADKLKQTAESKIISKDGGLLLKDNHGGATWAYEVGSQSMVCPIIVEDLNQPHQMLVEMICEERGLFLEIADIIRGLGLTILKGLMETRNDKIWAQFSVEANRNVTRMEIFLSLVRLLEQNAKTGVPQLSSTNNMMVQEVHQAAPLPASGGMLDDSIC